MVDYKLGNIEQKFADFIWEHAPLSTKELVNFCVSQLGWKRPTTYSVLRKLCEKGFFQMENSMVTVLTTKEEYNSIQSEKFVDETFKGSLPKMIVAFASRKKMSREEFDELYAAIESIQEDDQ